MNIIQTVTTAIKDNPFLTAILSFSGAGILTFWLKDVPKYMFSAIKKQVTIELSISSAHLAYHDILKWIAVKYPHTNFRRLKLSNGMWGYSETSVTSIGYGLHFIWYKKTPIMLNLVKDAANQAERERDVLTITKIGRSREMFDKLILEIQQNQRDTTKTNIFKMEDSWYHSKSILKRDFKNIFIEQTKKQLLLDALNKFIKSESWYVTHSIPYQIGILLYGPPGTGKTSIVKAIAGYLDYPIYYLSANKLGKIESAMSTLPDKCIVLIEDIDSNILTHTKMKKINTPKASDDSDTILEKVSSASFSDILNSLDGLFSAHGRVLIATTNHVDKLDPALLRPGRIDVSIEIGYVNDEILNAFLSAFFTDHQTITNVHSDKQITVATLQNMIISGKTKNEIIAHIQ